jgi:WhiB family redox-sensing transcriptional regulator
MIFDGTQLCAKVDPEVFFPESSDRASVEAAKAICNKCHFIEPCLKSVIWEPSVEGIWGGTTPRQRETMRSRLRRMQSASN